MKATEPKKLDLAQNEFEYFKSFLKRIHIEEGGQYRISLGNGKDVVLFYSAQETKTEREIYPDLGFLDIDISDANIEEAKKSFFKEAKL